MILFDYGQKKREKLGPDEIEALKKARKENFGYFHDWNGCYLEGIYSFTLVIFLIIIVITHNALLLYTLTIIYSNLSLFSECVHYVILCVATNSMVFTVLYFRDNIDRSWITIGKGFFNYENSLDEDTYEEVNRIKSEGFSRKKLLSKSFCYLFGVALVFVVFRPLLEIATGTGFEHDFVDVINFPLRIWVPFTIEDTFYVILTITSQFYGFTLTAMLWMGLDTYQICILQEIITNLEICNVTLRNFEKRANHVFKSTYGRKVDPGKKEDQKNIQRIIKKCLNTSVRHHYKIREFFEDAYELGYYPYLIILTTITVLLFLAIAMSTSDTVPFQIKVNFALMASVYALHYLIYCVLGEQITTSSKSLGNALYNGKWFGHMEETKVYVSMIQNMCLQPLELSAGGFATLSHDSFSTMVNTAFSYLNVLRASQ